MHRLANWPVRLLLLCLLLLGAGSLIAAGYLVTQDQYVIYDGDTAVSVSGSFATVQEVLDAAALQIRPADLVVPPLTDPASPDIAIQIQRAKAVILRTEAEGARTFWTQQPTLAAFLQEVGVSVQRTTQVFANGTLIPFGALTQAAVPDEIEIGRFLTIITIDDGERQQIVRTAKQTVGASAARSRCITSLQPMVS
ncbi:MAG: ubiquitin-like domain-containing protein [Chloroflexota bacterium]